MWGWIFVGISIAMGTFVQKILNNNKMNVTGIFNTIRKNGIGICYEWSNKIFSNTVGKYLIELHHTHYIINYPFGVNWYKIIIPRKRGPCMIDEIMDEKGCDIKEKILSFMGPCHNFHGQEMTPKILGYGSITFTFINEDIKTFTGDEIIRV